MRDKTVVTIEPPNSTERLDIADAFQQVLDFLRLFELAAGDDVDFDWKLERASTNSPFTVVAFSPTLHAAPRGESLAVAQRRAELGLKQLSTGAVPNWMRKPQRTLARRISKRFKAGIGRVSLRPNEQALRHFSFNASDANKALLTLEKIDGFEDINIPKHRAYGEIEGTLLGAGTHYGRPTLLIQANGYDIVRCVFGREKLASLGDYATIREVWEHKRVRLVGVLSYAEGGELEQIAVDDMALFPSEPIKLHEIVDSDFTGGLDPIEYLEQLHAGGIN